MNPFRQPDHLQLEGNHKSLRPLYRDFHLEHERPAIH